MGFSFGLRPNLPIAAASRVPQPSHRRPNRMTNWLTFGAALGIPLGLGQIMGITTVSDVINWYPKLEKPSWTPPVAAFPVVWSLLYALMGAASYRVFMVGPTRTAALGYALQLGLNLAWQPLFFKAHNLKAAKIDITVLLAVLVPTILEFNRIDPLAGYLMLPYFFFSSFAAALTYRIAAMNAGRPIVKDA